MTIDQYKQPDGTYLVDDVTYDDAIAYMQIGILGFCGCGNTDDNLRFVLSILRLLHDRSNSHMAGFEPYTKDLIRLCGGEIQLYFVLYTLDSLQLIEHGSSIGGSWPTPKGIDLINDLTELLP